MTPLTTYKTIFFYLKEDLKEDKRYLILDIKVIL